MNKFRLILIVLLSLMFIENVNAEMYMVCVGVADYKNDDLVKDLNLPDDDARTIANIYRKSTSHITLLVDKDATKQNIINAMKYQFGKAKPEDQVIFYFSGHGFHGGFAPYDAYNSLESLLSFKEIFEELANCKAHDKIIIADACFSGGIINDCQGVNSIRPSTVLMFMAARTNEESRENPGMKNGIFTAYFEAGLRGAADYNSDKYITAKELFNYVNAGVRKHTFGKQHPVMYGHFADNLVLSDIRKFD